MPEIFKLMIPIAIFHSTVTHRFDKNAVVMLFIRVDAVMDEAKNLFKNLEILRLIFQQDSDSKHAAIKA